MQGKVFFVFHALPHAFVCRETCVKGCPNPSSPQDSPLLLQMMQKEHWSWAAPKGLSRRFHESPDQQGRAQQLRTVLLDTVPVWRQSAERPGDHASALSSPPKP